MDIREVVRSGILIYLHHIFDLREEARCSRTMTLTLTLIGENGEEERPERRSTNLVCNLCLSETIPALNMRVKAFIFHFSRFIELALTAVPFLMEPCPCCVRKPWLFGWEYHKILTDARKHGCILVIRRSRNLHRIYCKNIFISYLDDKSSSGLWIISRDLQSESCRSQCEILPQGTWLRAHQIIGPPLIRLPSVPHNNPPHLLIKTFVPSRLVLDTQIKAEKTCQGGGGRLQTAEMRLVSKEFRTSRTSLRLNHVLFTETHFATG